MTARRMVLWGALIPLLALAACGSDAKDEGSSKKEFDPIAKAVKECVRPGEEATVETTNAKGANIAYLVTYADGKGRSDAVQPKGDADSKGVFRGSWVVPKDAPAGPGLVRIAVAAPPNGKQITAAFAVADASGKCDTVTPTTAALASSTTARTGTTAVGQTTVPGSPTTTAAGGSGSTTTTELQFIEGGDFKTTVTFTKKCVNAGDEQTIKVQTVEHAAVTYAITYASDTSGGDSDAGTSDSKGVYEDTFNVNAKASSGTATAQVTVQASGGLRSFSGARFKVGNC